LFRADVETGVGVIVGGDFAVHANVDAGFLIADDCVAASEERTLSGLEVVGGEMAGFEIVFSAVATPRLPSVLDTHISFGNDIAVC